MAKSKTSVLGGRATAMDSRLLPLDFSAKEGLEIDDWLASREPGYQPDVIRVLDAGWKISLSYSAYYQLYFLSYTGKETGTQYDGYTLSVKHPDFNRLFSVLEYVALVYLADGRAVLPASREGGGW